MVLAMNNNDAQLLIDGCKRELGILKIKIDSNPMSNIVPFLTKYSIMKTCGTIEQVFKMIITERCYDGSTSQQAKNYIDATFRNNSQNPSMDNIHRSLKLFCEDWNNNFKLVLQSHSNPTKLKTSLKSLNALRNEFAHGGNPTTSIDDVIDYFGDALMITVMIDSAIV